MLKDENSEKRTKLLQDAETKFLDSASIGPLYQQGVARLRQPYVKTGNHINSVETTHLK